MKNNLSALLTIIIVFAVPNLLAQNKKTISVFSGFLLNSGTESNKSVNLAPMIDRSLIGISYSKSYEKYSLAFDFNFIEAEIATTSNLFFRNSDQGAQEAFANMKAVSTDYELMVNTTVIYHKLNQFNKLFPHIHLGLGLLLPVSSGGGVELLDTQTDQIIVSSNGDYERFLTPFIMTGISYRILNYKGISVPIELGVRLPIFRSYLTQDVKVFDVAGEVSERFNLHKSGLSTTIRLGISYSF